MARVEYLVGLEEGAAKAIGARAPADLLEEMLEVQEALEEAKAVGRVAVAETREHLMRERERLIGRRAAADESLVDVGRRWDAVVDGSGRVPSGQNALRLTLLDRMKGILAARAYLTTVINDLSEALGEETHTNVSHRRH